MAWIDLERWWKWAIPVAAAVLMLAGVAGCGVKGPPVPPQRPPLPAVEALTGYVEGDTVTLNWRHNPDIKGVAGYVVLRAQSNPEQPPCPDCPVVYQRAGTISTDKHSRQITFSEQVPIGFRYTYVVRSLGAAGDQGPDNVRVEIDRWEP